MAEMTTEIAIHCMKAENCEEVCQDCLMYGKVGTDHCEYDAHRLAIKALDTVNKIAEIIKIEKQSTSCEHTKLKSFEMIENMTVISNLQKKKIPIL